MTARPATAAAIVRALLACAAVLALAGQGASALAAAPPGATAATAGLSVPGVSVSVPSVGVSTSGVSVSTPSAGVSTSGVSVSVPEASVSTPSVGVSTSGVSVSVPEASVSTPSVGVSTSGVSVSVPAGGVSTPGVGVSTSGTPPAGSSEAPGGTSPPKSSSGGSPTAPADPSSPHGPTDPSGATALSTPGAGASTDPVAPAPADRDSIAGAAHASTSTPGGPRVASARGARGARRTRARAAATRASTSAAALVDSGRAAGAPGAGARRRAHAGAAGGALAAIGRRIPLPIPVPDWSKPIIVALLLLALALGARAAVSTRRARRLEGQRGELLRDLDAMQAALVPEVPARVGGLDVSVAYRPADGPAAGGDFYDVFASAPEQVAIVLGDVAGHGRDALTQAALTRYTLRAYLQAGMEPRAALALAGRALAGPDAESYATVIVAVYSTHDGKLTYASGGHHHPIVHGLPARAPLAIYASPPVGWGVPTGRRQTTLSLPAGAVVCFFSDGLVEARCGEQLLGTERLSEMLAELGARPGAAALLERVRASATATPDDMAACILTPVAERAVAPAHVEEIEVDARALASGGVERFLRSCGLPAEQVASVLARAGDIAASSATALVRVELGQDGARATVSHSAQARPAPRRRRGEDAAGALPRALSRA
jgi:Stage II sporulation protein E (SpoIIE)